MGDWLEVWQAMQVETARIRQQPFGTIYARSLTTELLVALWDRYDGCDDSIGDDQISGEAIHYVLNERGEGSHCAV